LVCVGGNQPVRPRFWVLKHSRWRWWWPLSFIHDTKKKPGSSSTRRV
jgi:hypothetical protein